MAERLNCVQNAMTIRNQVLIRNKVAGFIISKELADGAAMPHAMHV